jgi:hypothetical protein
MPPSVPPSFPDDDLNPYAPPRPDLRPELIPAAGDLRTIPFSIGDVVSRTWEIYRDRMGMCIGVVIGCTAMEFAAQVAYSAARQVAPLARNPQAVGLVIGVGGFLAVIAFRIWIYIGQTIVMLDIARGRDADFGDIFTGGRFLFRAIVAGILYILIIVGPIVLGALPGGLVWAATGRDSPAGPIALGLSVFAGVVVSVILSLRLSQFFYLIIDRDASILDSLRISYEITRGKAGMIFVIYLLTGALNFAGALACLIGMIFTLPFGVLLLIVTYLALTGQPTADPYAKGEPMADLEPL